ncbi:MAG TPA: ice-binding family protein [Acidimicrobiales bacterium]|nr:ice-binding family protein [Acidimicrobiales bacterium]
MFIVGTLVIAVVILAGLTVRRWRVRATVLAFVAAAIALLTPAGTASAAVVPTVPLGVASSFAVLGAETVTNVGPTTLDGDLGVSPGTAIVGFPPGQVLAPWTTYANDAVAASAQAALTTAYVNAATRSVDNDITAQLSGVTLIPGVSAGPGGGALLNSGNLTFDGQGLTDPVFIIQAAELTTATGSTMTLINGADACNVYWQIGSSATLGTSSVFQGTIMALASVSVLSGATVHGRALARTAAVTLIDDTFTSSACVDDETTTTTTTTTEAPTTEGTTTEGTTTEGPTTEAPTTDGGTTTTTTTTTTGGSSGVPFTGTTAPGSTTPDGSITTRPGDSTYRGSTTSGPSARRGPDVPAGPGVPGVSGPPRTGGAPAALDGPGGREGDTTVAFGAAGCVGLALIARDRTKRPTARPR